MNGYIFRIVTMAFILISLLISMAQSEVAAGPLIKTDQRLSPETIHTRDSGISPSSSNVVLSINGQGKVPRKSIDAILVMDISNSMGEPHLSAAKNAAKKFISGMDKSRDKIGFVAFNSEVGPNISPVSTFEEVIKTIDAVKIDRNNEKGDTCLSVGLAKATDMLKNEKDASQKVIVFLSDGNNTTCKKANDNPCAEAVNAGDYGIIIYSIGLNDSGNGTRYLKCMAETTGGSYYSKSDDDLERIYESLSRNIPNIIARNVVVNYQVQGSLEIGIKEPGLYLDKKKNSISYNLGTISSNEVREIPFTVSSTKSGNYTLGIDPGSIISYVGLDGKKMIEKFSKMNITIIDNETLDPPNPKSSFNLIGSGKTIEIVHPVTGIRLKKIIERNETSNQPRIVLQITTPPIRYADFVLAVDSSGSMLEKGREKAIRSAIPTFLSKLSNKTLLKANISVVSWDDKLDFAYGGNSSKDYKKIDGLKLVPIDKSLKDINYLFNSDKYYCNETEATLLDEGLKPSVDILESNPPTMSNNTSRFIILVVGPSEFKNCSDVVLKNAINHSIKIGVVGVGFDQQTYMWRTLKKIADYSGVSVQNPAPDSTDLTARLEEELNGIAKEVLTNSSIADNVVIVDTLYPYIVPETDSIKGAELDSNGYSANADGSHTLILSIKEGLKPNTTCNVSFDFNVNIVLPAEVERNKRTNVEFNIYNSTPSSALSYDWTLDEKRTRYAMDLPENEIRLETNALQSPSNEPIDTHKETPLESGLITLFCISILYILKRDE